MQVHISEPGWETELDGQGRQAPLEALQQLAQQSHDADPGWELEFGGQGVHDVSPGLENEPAAQAILCGDKV